MEMQMHTKPAHAYALLSIIFPDSRYREISRNIELRDINNVFAGSSMQLPTTTLSVNPASSRLSRGCYPIPINFNDERGQFNTLRESL